LVVLGRGEQSLAEARAAQDKGKKVMMIDLPTFRD
jgi:hypothetical protein